MCFRLVPKLMTLKSVMAATLSYATEFGSFDGNNYRVELREFWLTIDPYCLRQKCSPKNVVSSNI